MFKAVVLVAISLIGCGTSTTAKRRVGLKPLDVRDSNTGAAHSSSDAVGADPSNQNGSNIPSDTHTTTIDPSATDSVSVFGRTVYPLVRQWCVGCHESIQTPFFAQADIQKAHDQVLLTQKVDFTNIGNSRLIQRLATDQHNCPTEGCAAAAKQMTDAVTAWAQAITQQTSNTTQLMTTDTHTFADAKAATVPGMNPDGVMLFEAEAFTLTPPMEQLPLAGASGGMIIDTPTTAGSITNATTAQTSTTLGKAIMTFNVKTAGSYRVQGYVNGVAAANSSFYLSQDNGTLIPWVFTATGMAYAWSTASRTATGTPTQLTLAAGSHTLEIRQRQGGAKIDKVVLSSIPTFDPATAQPATRNVTVLSFDLSGITHIQGSALTVEVSDYSANAYMISNPTLLVPSGSIHVKDLRLLINGEFSPQNATFTVIDKTVAAPGGLLLNAALVAVKDKGIDQDQFSFAFGTIEVK